MHPRNEGAYRSIADLPEAPDAAFVGVNAQATVDVVGQLAAIGAGGAVCYAAGFAEAGDAELERALVEAAGEMALLGPNCYGLVNRVDGASLWPVPYPLPRVERGIGLVLQSGNLGINLSMADRSLPVAFILTVGNQAGLDVAASVDLLLDQPETTGIGIYLEGLRDAALFADAAARALERGIPIVVVKSGASEVGAQVTATHTSSLAGSDELYDAFFERLGVARAPDMPALLETLKAQTAIGPLRGRRDDRVHVLRRRVGAVGRRRHRGRAGAAAAQRGDDRDHRGRAAVVRRRRQPARLQHGAVGTGGAAHARLLRRTRATGLTWRCW